MSRYGVFLNIKVWGVINFHIYYFTQKLCGTITIVLISCYMYGPCESICRYAGPDETKKAHSN